MNDLIGCPNLYIKEDTIKNRKPLLIELAKINMIKSILKAPDEIVNSLNGTGVNPAVKTIQKLYSLYKL